MSGPRVWNTNCAPHGHALSYWSEAVCEAVFELELESSADDCFEASIHQQDFGPAVMSKMAITPVQTVRRTGRLISRSNRSQLELINMRKGAALLKHRAHEVRVNAGE